MNVHIRQARKDDMAAVLDHIQQLADYEQEPDAVKVTLKDLINDGFGEHPLFRVHVAELKEELVGIALFYTGYSTWKGRMVYLDDLYVEPGYRNYGIGKKLLDSVLDYARETGARLVKWQVLDWNEPAIKFYEKYNVEMDGDWVDCKVQAHQLYPKAETEQ